MFESVRFALWRLRDRCNDGLRRTHRRDVFDRIYSENLWGDRESFSGPGSSIAGTHAIRSALPNLLKQFEVKTLLDAPCGDLAWSGDLIGQVDRYIGVDIVPELIARNKERYESPRASFMCADIALDRLPSADMVLCRDCFIHLPTRLICGAVRNFRSTGAQFLLMTNDAGAGLYHDIPLGSFRPIDFRQPPFSFPEPLSAIAENPNGRQLCLWNLQSLRI